MKNSILAASILSVAFAVTAAAQVNPAISAVNSPVSRSVTTKPEAPPAAKTTRARVLTPSQNSPATNNSSVKGESQQAHAKSNFKNRARLESLPAEVSSSDKTRVRSVTSSTAIVSESKTATNKIVAEPNAKLNVNATNATLNPAASQIYRVGVGDVLDIQLQNNSSPESTLFTVLNGS